MCFDFRSQTLLRPALIDQLWPSIRDFHKFSTIQECQCHQLFSAVPLDPYNITTGRELTLSGPLTVALRMMCLLMVLRWRLILNVFCSWRPGAGGGASLARSRRTSLRTWRWLRPPGPGRILRPSPGSCSCNRRNQNVKRRVTVKRLGR